MDKFSFTENESKPLSPGLFGLLVLERVRKIQEIEVIEQNSLEFKLKVSGRNVAARLDRFYERYRADPAKLSAIVDEWIDAIALLPAPATEFNFDEISMHLLPMLKSSGFIDQANRATASELVSRPFLRNLHIAYVVDAAKTIEYVNVKELAQWNRDAQELHTHAMANLARRTRDVEFDQFGEGKDTLIVDQKGDGYAATRVLVDDYISYWAELVEGELLIGIPNRDFMIGFARDNPNREAIAMQIGADAHAHENPLTDTLLVWRDGRIQEYSE